MSARLTRAERAELAAAWPDFGQVLATIERILTDRLAEAEVEIEAIRAERDEAVRQMVAQVTAHRVRTETAEAALADLRAAVEALESRWSAALDDGCPSCGPVGFTGCDHIEGYHHALSDLRAVPAQRGGE